VVDSDSTYAQGHSFFKMKLTVHIVFHHVASGQGQLSGFRGSQKWHDVRQQSAIKFTFCHDSLAQGHYVFEIYRVQDHAGRRYCL